MTLPADIPNPEAWLAELQKQGGIFLKNAGISWLQGKPPHKLFPEDNPPHWEDYVLLSSDAQYGLVQAGLAQPGVPSAVPSKTKEAVFKSIASYSQREPGRQLSLFSPYPTEFTRTGPFFLISKQDRQLLAKTIETLTYTNAWGTITFKGERLSISDQSVLLALLALVKRCRSSRLQTTISALCQIMRITTGGASYKAILAALDRMVLTSIRLDTKKPRHDDQGQPIVMNGNIITHYTLTGKNKSSAVIIQLNDYFLEMFAASFITHVDTGMYFSLEGDTTKALYVFLCGQDGDPVAFPVPEVVRAINMKSDLPTKKLRARLREAADELKKQGAIAHYELPKKDGRIYFFRSAQALP